MKKLFTIFALFTFFSTAFATKHTVTVANFSFSPQSLTIDPGDTVVFEFTSGTHTVTSVTNSWTEIASSAPATFELSEPFKESGTYEYFCKPHQSMGMTGSITVNTVTGTIDLARKEAINVYPNPFAGKLNISIPSGSGVTSIRITDANGKEVERTTVSTTELSVDLSGLQSGFYYCTLYSKDAIVETKKVYHK